MPYYKNKSNNNRKIKGANNNKQAKKSKKRKNTRTNALAKKAVAKAQDPLKPRLSGEDYKKALEIARRAIAKERRARMQAKYNRDVTSVEIRTPYRPFNSSLPLDIVSADNYVRIVMNILGMEFPLFDRDQGIQPYKLRFYFLTLIFSYLKKVGKLTGFYANQVPELQDTYEIPYAMAKFLEYLGPARKYGCQQTTEIAYNVDFIANSDASGYGDGMTQINQGGTVVLYNYGATDLNLLMTMVSILQPIPTSATVPVDQPSFVFTSFNPGVQLNKWMSDEGNMSQVSSVLKTLSIPCVTPSFLPGFINKRGQAPDSSAYCAFNQPTGLGVGDDFYNNIPPGLCWLNVHDDYDPDLGAVFALSRTVTTQPAIAAKPVPTVLTDYSVPYSTSNLQNPVPWYLQTVYVAAWLAGNTTEFKRGHWKDLPIGNDRLETFIPNPRTVGAASIYTAAAHCYQEIQTLQSQATRVGTTGTTTTGGFANEYPDNQYWWALWTTTAQALQRRFNAKQVVVCNAPLVDEGTGTSSFMMPQINWVDSSSTQNELPKVLSDAIDKLGPVIYKGRLLIPRNVMAGSGGNTSLPYPVPSTALYGPIGWSAYGPQPALLQTYQYENLMTPVTFSESPIAAWNVKLNYLSINNAFASVYAGWDAANKTLYPMFFGGQWVRIIENILKQFIQSGNQVNTIAKNFDKPEDPLLGGASVMVAETVPQFGAVEQEPLLPNNLVKVGPVSQPLSLIRIPTVGITSQVYDSEAKTLLAMTDGLVQDYNQPVSRPDTYNRYTASLIFAVASDLTLPSAPPINPSGMLNVTSKSMNAISGVIGQLCHDTLNPDSEFAKAKVLINHARASVGQVVPKNKKKLLSMLSTTRALHSEAVKFAGAAFNNNDRALQISSASLGRVGKGTTDAAAGNIAIVDSNTTVTSNEGGSIAPKKTIKATNLKEHTKKMHGIGKALRDTAKTVGKGIDDATKAVAEVPALITKGTEALGSLFS